ncbi:MAG: tyrosine-protein phosphatase [Pseudomonadota bacterium]
MSPLLKTSLLALSAGLLAACGNGPGTLEESRGSASVQSADVSYDMASGTYDVSWDLTRDASVDILVADSPDAARGTLIAEDVSAGNFNWTPEDGSRDRRYFFVRPDGGKAQTVAARLLPLEGGRNFRDLGGYKTEDGRTVKWGRVYRSGTMNSLTDADYDYLSGLGIKTVCDFREADERDNEPTNWRAGDIEYLTFAPPVDNEDPASNPMFAALLDPDSTPDDVAEAMAAGYFGIAEGEAEGYTAMFDELAAGRVPLAFNCSAGKDRAGTAAALVLTALGVPRETVVEDYSLSDDYVDFMAEFLNDEARAEAEAGNSPYAFLFELPPEKVAPLMASHPMYIEASLDQMADEHGSVLAFIQSELDVTDEELSAIRSNLLD